MRENHEREQPAGSHGGGSAAHAAEPTPGGDLCFLDPRAVRARRNERGKLVLTLGGGVETVEGVRPLRAFPLTAPDRQIVLIDAEDNELGVIRELKALDRESREVIEAELEVVYLVPRVRNILSVLSRFGITTWELETDRGRAHRPRQGAHRHPSAAGWPHYSDGRGRHQI